MSGLLGFVCLGGGLVCLGLGSGERGLLFSEALCFGFLGFADFAGFLRLRAVGKEVAVSILKILYETPKVVRKNEDRADDEAHQHNEKGAKMTKRRKKYFMIQELAKDAS